MQNFPVSSSVLSAAHLAPFVQQQYALGNETSCKLIKAGINHTYLLEDGNRKFILRVYILGWRNELEIREELRLIELLHENGIPVSYPIQDSKGEYLQVLQAPEGTRFGVLFSYAEGQKQHNFAEETQRVIGQTIGSIHQLTEGLKLERTNFTAQTLLINSFEAIKKIISADTEEMVFMQAAQQYLLAEYAAADQTKIRKGAVHLDIWFDNLNVDEHNNITIFDFDFCGNGWLCMDVAYYLLQLYVVETNESVYHAKAAVFLEGYESVNPLSEEEKRLLPMLGACLYFFYLGVQCERFEDYSNVFMNETYLKRYIQLRVKRHLDFYKLSNLFL